ncbi:MAG: phosphatidylglycerophosphatase A [Elusimicrobia bacterium]|nr:phosphatidylglycerophosphatase A [Elusimicrobiota bacterium]
MGLARLDSLAVALATGFYLSYIPSKLLGFFGRGGSRKWTGAGFIGTVEGLALIPLLPESPASYLVLLSTAVLASCGVCGRAERALGSHDDPRIVLDEVVGMWTAAALLPRTVRVLGAAFVLFRLLDSVKLPPYRWLERLPGGWGIVADDVGAAIVANLTLRILLNHWPWLNY